MHSCTKQREQLTPSLVSSATPSPPPSFTQGRTKRTTTQQVNKSADHPATATTSWSAQAAAAEPSHMQPCFHERAAAPPVTRALKGPLHHLSCAPAQGGNSHRVPAHAQHSTCASGHEGRCHGAQQLHAGPCCCDAFSFPGAGSAWAAADASRSKADTAACQVRLPSQALDRARPFIRL